MQLTSSLLKLLDEALPSSNARSSKCLNVAPNLIIGEYPRGLSLFSP